MEMLRLLADELYGDRDPVERMNGGRAFTITNDGDDVIVEMKMPFTEKGDVGVLRQDDELYITVGAYKRSLVLPDSLKRRVVKRAKLDAGVLRVTFVLEN